MDFCTYFDSNYLPRGLALIRSLKQHCPGFRLWVLCFDEASRRVLDRLALPEVNAVALPQFEKGDKSLAWAKGNRSLVEYYFTCSPSWPRWILDNHPDVDTITYLDADLFFYSSPKPIFEELKGKSVGIIEHRFSDHHAHMIKNGRFNVGWVTVGRDGRDCLEWWRDRCNEWCYDYNDNGRYADQQYLDHFEELFDGVHVIHHPGANLAPWNLPRHEVQHGKPPAVDGKPLIFFHFHGLRRVGWNVYDPNLEYYGIKPSGAVKKGIFEPYIKELCSIEQMLHEQGFKAEFGKNRYFFEDGGNGPRQWLRAQRFLVRKVIQGDFLFSMRGRVL